MSLGGRVKLGGRNQTLPRKHNREEGQELSLGGFGNFLYLDEKGKGAEGGGKAPSFVLA